MASLRSARTYRCMLVFHVTQSVPLYWPYMFMFVTQVRGLAPSDFGLLKSVYYFAVMLGEVPLGVVADRLGRRTTLVLAALANAGGCALYAWGRGFPEYVGAELTLALATALQSGADSALLFDAYAADGRAHEFARATGALESVGLAGATVAFVLAGLLVVDGDPTPTFFATALVSLVGAGAALAVVEPPRTSTGHVRQHVAETLRDLAHTPGLIATVVYAALVYAGLRAANALVWNPVLARSGVPLSAYGALTAVVTLLGAFSAWRADRWLRALGPASLALGVAGFIAGMYALLALAPGASSAALIASHGLPMGVAPVLVADLLNRRIHASERRATLLSFESLAQRGLYGVLVLFGARALEQHGLAAVLLCFALLAALSLALVPRLARGL